MICPPLLQSIRYTNFNDDLHLRLAERHLQIGCVLGCLLAACIGLRLGRRWTIITGCILVTIGGAVQAAAYNPGMSGHTRSIHLVRKIMPTDFLFSDCFPDRCWRGYRSHI